MEKEKLGEIIALRVELIKKFERLRDYKIDQNAIMKQVDCARMLHEAIVKLDNILKDDVTFK